jgi:hypothetical protein
MKSKFKPPAQQPEFIRLPRNGERCPYSSLTRTAMDQLVRPQAFNDFNPPVESRIVRSGQGRRGSVFISYRSLMAYLSSQPTPEEMRRLIKREATATK